MQSLIDKLYKELLLQQKYLKREDVRSAKKSNQLILKIVTLIEQESKKESKKINVNVNVTKNQKKSK